MSCKHFYHPDCKLTSRIGIHVKFERVTPSIKGDMMILRICFFLRKKKQISEISFYTPLMKTKPVQNGIQIERYERTNGLTD